MKNSNLYTVVCVNFFLLFFYGCSNIDNSKTGELSNLNPEVEAHPNNTPPHIEAVILDAASHTVAPKKDVRTIQGLLFRSNEIDGDILNYTAIFKLDNSHTEEFEINGSLFSEDARKFISKNYDQINTVCFVRIKAIAGNNDTLSLQNVHKDLR
ncbi:hypothetical protein [Lewinella sp. LCG006]|uniref:hypothetical protein n=1 Tax=Lewinella sp. LCG006 TaxID=3231911 RepID=UPI003460D7F6